MILRKAMAAAFVAAGARSSFAVARSGNQIERGLYTTSACVSVIALAGSPDYRYLQENGIDEDIYDQGEEFVCELSSGLTVPIKGTDDQIQRMRNLLNEGKLISYEMTIGVADNFIPANGDDSVYLPPGDIILAPRNEDRRERQRVLRYSEVSHPDAIEPYRRNLQIFEGTKPILAVRVTDSEGNAHPDTADVISDKVFGTDGDVANLKTQFDACSFGKLQVTNEYTVDISQHLSAPGVIDIDIPVPLLGNDRKTIRGEMINAAQEKLGFNLPGPFHSVMFVLEQCYTDCGWAAYAYVNSWFSVYQGNNYKYVGVQMHEIGHNLNMAHSGGLDGRVYTDHTCLLGNPYYSDNMGVMCFNPAKSFQIAKGRNSWYNENAHDIVVWNSEKAGESPWWSGTIIGIADYQNNPHSRPVIVKIESGGPDDLFVGLNRATGINKDTADARDQVTVIEAGNDGLSYAQSFLVAALSQGESYSVTNWRNSGVDLTIHVKEINIDVDPGYADILISHGDLPSQVEPTNSPTQNPTKYPTKKPTNSPIEGTCGNSVCDLEETSSNCPIDCSGKELETTFDYNLGSGGNMFTIEAKRNVSISAIAINANSRGEGEVKVYTRKGGYDGHIQSSAGWQLVYDNPTLSHARRGQATELGSFQQDVIISEGESHSFFVTSSRGLVYKSGTQEKSITSSDESLSILEGIGTDGTFSSLEYSPRIWGGKIWYNVIGPTMAPGASSPVTSATCGDGVCDMEEGSESCALDCALKELETTYEFSLGSSGNMFSVKALRDISVSSLVLNAMARGEGAVKVYTRNGSYIGHERSSEGWELLYDDPAVIHDRRGKRTELGNFDNAVPIASGATQSFFVTSTNGLVYESGTTEGAEYVSDDSLVIYEGVGTTDEFAGTIHRPRVFGGAVRYQAHQTITDLCGDSICGANEDSWSCPIDCRGKELETTFEFSLGSSGNMFSVKALRDISVTSLALNAMSRGEGAVKVYTRNGSYSGHERNSQGWELIYDNNSVTHNRRGRKTELGDFDNGVHIGSGDTQSFFVTSSQSLVYEAGTEEGAEYASDDSIVIFEGLGTTDEFSGTLYSPRVFGGIIRYDIR